jgi:hypothetical protein
MSFQGFLKQSTAVDVLLGPFLDEDDGKTAEAGLTISQADVKLSKNGQSLAQKNDANACAADGTDGYYNCPLNTTDTNTVGQLTVIVHESGALPVRLDYHVVEEAVYDAMYGGLAAGPLQPTTAGRKLDVSDTGEAGLDFDNIKDATGAHTLTNITVPTTTAVTDGVSLANGAITDASLAGNMEIVFETDFSTNYNQTRNAWVTNAQDFVGTTAADPFSGQIVAASVTAKTGYSLASDGMDSVTLPANIITATSIDGDAITSDKIADDAIGDEHWNVTAASVNLVQINGTAIAGTGSQVAAAFEYFFDVVSPAKTINDCGVEGSGLSAEDVWTYATRVLTAGTNIDGSTFDALPDVTIASDGMDSVTLPADIITAASINTGAFTADAFAADALVAATFADNSLDGKGDWGTGGDATEANQTAILAAIGTPVGASLAADIGEIDPGSPGIPFAPETDNSGDTIKFLDMVGTQTTGTYAALEADDGSVHRIDHATNAIDIVYQYDIESGRIPACFTWKGYLTGSTNSISIKVYDFDTPTWDLVGSVSGGTGEIQRQFPLLSQHVGSAGADEGKVLLRFTCTEQTSPILFTDRMLVFALHDSAVAEIQSGLATTAAMTAAFTEVKGATWDSSTDTLEAIRNRGDAAWITGGAGAITVSPIAGTVASRFTAADIDLVQYEEVYFGPLVITDTDGTAIDLSGLALAIVVYPLRGPVTEAWRWTTGNSEISVSGDDNNQITITDDATYTQSIGAWAWVLWDTTNNRPKQYGGTLHVKRCAPPSAD